LALLRAKVKAPPKDRSTTGSLLRSEMRARLSNMPPVERTNAILKAVKDGDDSLAAAAMESGFLSGLSALELEHVGTVWRSTRHPKEVKRIADLEKVETHLRRAGSLLQQFAIAVADQEIVKATKASTERAAAAIAAATIQ
jgi:hypothetical protein